ncbi:MAG: hypothetical protein ACRELX_18600 [Longimicrobiales bacterium]
MFARKRMRAGHPNWKKEETWWRENFHQRPYVSSDRGFDFYGPGYRYGYESATKLVGREWDEVEPELRRNWERWEHRGESGWEEIKDSVKDAWHRATADERPRD